MPTVVMLNIPGTLEIVSILQVQVFLIYVFKLIILIITINKSTVQKPLYKYYDI